ncbi:MAG TPA: Asp-tRNA(Asn)/Glu-tRNA(Gln) amidotransferase subunit GatC [Candidatus Paceibacterota bacterium]|nr:Asp-tRNA(Asn)/Glu-tRNA(Gln) amidotransferase subunit GatC [Candidatus Paceibacterota bacterium]
MNKQDVKKFADLARIEMSDDELAKMAGEIDSVLSYVDQIKGAVSNNGSSENSTSENGPSEKFSTGKIRVTKNIFREDVLAKNSTESVIENRKKILAEVPNAENEYVKVKKIL